MKVGILGGGRWGQALARLVKAAGNKPLIAYRDKRDKPPQMLPSTLSAPLVSETCDLIFVATSASQVKSAIQAAHPGPHNRVVVAGRGVDPSSGAWLSDVIVAECDAVRVGALGGPAPADEILNGGLCAGVIASPFNDVRALTIKALHSKRFRVYDSPDLIGVQLASATVPVLSTLIGLTHTLGGAGVGLYAMCLCRGLAEAQKLALALNADPASLMGFAGVGDLITTQAKAGSPYYDAGVRLAKGDLEAGPQALARSLVKQAHGAGVRLPLTEGLVSIYEGTQPLDVIQQLMAREALSESW